MRYYAYAAACLAGTIFGCGYIENPDNNIYVGMVVLYTFVGFLCYSIVQIVRKDHKQI